MTTADSAGLGRLRLMSALGQPLRAEIDITAVSADEVASLAAKISSAEVFEQSNLSYPVAISDLRLTIDTQPDGRRIVRLSSSQAINDPYLELMIELYWSTGRFLRQYTFLLDPPELRSVAPPAPVLPAQAVAPPVPESVISQVTPAGSSTAEAPVAPATNLSVAPSVAAPSSAVNAVKPTTPSATSKAPRPSSRSAKLPAAETAESGELTASAPEATPIVVEPGDTLVGIANQFKPEHVELDTMLVGLFRANPKAFYDGNMNLLKAGSVLRLPNESMLSAINPKQAHQSVRAHVDDFYTYRKRLVKSAKSAPVVKADNHGSQTSTGKISDEVLDKTAAPTSAQDQLKINHATGTGKTDAKTREDLMAEEMSARDHALKDAQSRVTDLERNLNDMRQLLAAQNKVLAEFERRARQAAETAAKTPPPIASVPAAAPAVPAAVPPASPVAVPADLPEPDSVAPVVVPKPPVKSTVEPKPESVPPTPVAQSSGGMLPAVLGLAGLLALLAGGLGWRAWRGRQKIPASSLPLTPINSETLIPAVETTSSILNSRFGEVPEESAPGAASDPIAEADVYIAYGRDAQAEEILKEGLRQTPERQALRLKLLEIYAARKDMPAFNATMDEIEQATSATGNDWARAIAIGSVVDPENPRYADAGSPDFSDTSPGGLPGFDDPEKTVRIDPLAREALMAEAAATPLAADQAYQAYQPELGTAFAMTNPSLVEEDAQLAQTAISPIDLDFDLDLGNRDTPTAPADLAPAIRLAAAETPLPTSPSAVSEDDMIRTSVDLNSLDFDVPATTEVLTGEPLTAELVKSSEEIFAPVQLDPTNEVPNKGLNEGMEVGRVKLNLPDSLDLDADLPVDEAATLPLSDLASASEFDGTATQIDITVQQEMSTKLDLASAYIDIGDKDGARELLQEVIDGGSPEQQVKARQTMTSLD